MRVSIAQVAPGTPMPRIAEMLSGRGDIFALPEYVTAAPGDAGPRQTAGRFQEHLQALGDLSRSLGGVLLGGTLVEPDAVGLYNTAPVLQGGRLCGQQRKNHPTSRERRRGIVPGRGIVAITAGDLRIAVLVCADVLQPGAFGTAARVRPDIVFVPTTSPLRLGEGLDTKAARDRSIFVRGAQRAAAFVIKASATGSVYGSPLQGRSLVAAPWGELLAAVPPEREGDELVLGARLDLDRLAAWRRRQGDQAGSAPGGG